MKYLDETLAANISADETAMTVEEASNHIENLTGWELLFDESMGYHLSRFFDFTDADKAREYIQELKEIAEEMHKIPSVVLKGKQVCVMCYTPALKGLHRNDFIMAAHADDLYARWDVIMGERDKVTQASDESFPASDPPGY